MVSEKNIIGNQNSEIESWFNEIVANIRYDQTLLEIDLLEEKKKEMYKAFMSGNDNTIHHLGIQANSAHFIKCMIDTYFRELIKGQSKPNKLGLELSNSKILVWAEILEDDEVMEDTLILAEAKTNSLFSKYGFHISSTIVENTDGLEVPTHYKEVEINEN